jgi:N-ATPase, AtpR subunit
MTTAVLAPELVIATAFAPAGLVFGRLYFAALRRTVERLSTATASRDGSGSIRFLPAALTFARIAGATLFLGTAAQFGALPLLTAFLGFLVARSLSLRAARRTA